MIRRRLAAAIVGVVAVIIALAGLVVVARLEDRLISYVDDQLEARAHDIALFLDRIDDLPPEGFTDPRPLRDPEESPFRVQEVAFLRVGPDGSIVSSGPSGPETSPEPLPDVTGLEAPAGPLTVGPARGDEPRFRVLAAPTDDGGMIVLGISLARVDASVASATEVLVVAFSFALAVVAVVVWFTIRRGLRPINHMIGTAERIAAGDLTERTAAPNPSTEVGHLGRALNTMLDRIEEAVTAKTESEARLRRFVADASHELRTPLTSIRGYAELYRRGANEPDAVALGMRRIEREATRMSLLVEDLLLLARLDQGRPLAQEPVDLVAVVHDVAADAAIAEPARRITLDVPTGEVVVTGDRHRLRQVLDNLLANVREHADADTSVVVRLTATADSATLVVADDGPGMTAADPSRAFERFWQAEPTTEHLRRGTGLGLAIVRDLIAAHRGMVALEAAPGEGWQSSSRCRVPQLTCRRTPRTRRADAPQAPHRTDRRRSPRSGGRNRQRRSPPDHSP